MTPSGFVGLRSVCRVAQVERACGGGGDVRVETVSREQSVGALAASPRVSQARQGSGVALEQPLRRVRVRIGMARRPRRDRLVGGLAIDALLGEFVTKCPLPPWARPIP